MIVSWPSKIGADQAGGFVRQAAYLPDPMATCVALSGAEYLEGAPACEGKSLTPLLAGDDTPVHSDPVYWEHEGNAATRWGDWKLVRQYRQPWELYDIAQDRTELHDLSTAEADQRATMIAMWEAWATGKGVAFPNRFNMYEHLRELERKTN
jgi:arylsulfatase